MKFLEIVGYIFITFCYVAPVFVMYLVICRAIKSVFKSLFKKGCEEE